MNQPASFCFRPMVRADDELARCEAERRRFAAGAKSPEHCLLVAQVGSRIVGMLHVDSRPALEKPPEAGAQAIVVDHAFRARGIGKAFIAAAEKGATRHRYRSVSLSPHIARAEAHAFYKATGYQRFASSHLFRKTLPLTRNE